MITKHLPNGEQSALWKEVNSWMEFLVIVVNSHRNFFRVTGGVENELQDYLNREDAIIPGSFMYHRDQLIEAICGKINEYIE